MKKRLEARFSGSVQGVGFRYTTERIAGNFQVTGFVRNLSNGKVEIVAEGEEAALKDFLQAIKNSSMRPFIRETEIAWAQAQNHFTEFGIAY
ncbi:MAG: acylphosphatase [Candidatus Omnitrophica bacterium]|nr:acylphosphatase [Candidatus Omnitrophota bacterium]